MRQPKNFRKIYQLAGLFLLCIALVMLSYNVTSAWFMDESVTSNGDLNIIVVGTIDLEVTSNFDFYNLALAPDTIYTDDQNGEDIATYLSTGVSNNIDTIYVRVKFTSSRSELSLFFDGNVTTATVYDPDDPTLKKKWVYNETDGYYYYLGTIGTEKVPFNSGYLVNNSLDNSVANAEVSLSLVVDAIQRPYGAYKEDVDWKSAPEIFKDFAADDSKVGWR